MGRYGTENGPSKVARHSSQLIDGKAAMQYIYVAVVWLRDRIAKLKTRQIKKCGILAEIAKFNAHQIFPTIQYALYMQLCVGIVLVALATKTLAHGNLHETGQFHHSCTLIVGYGLSRPNIGTLLQGPCHTMGNSIAKVTQNKYMYLLTDLT